MGFCKKWFMYDYTRRHDCFNRHEMTLLLDMIQRLGFTGLGFYFEGYFEFAEFSLQVDGCVTRDDVQWLREETAARSLELMPMTNLLGHAESFLYDREEFAHMRKGRLPQFDLFNEELERFAQKRIDEILECFQPALLHLGGDEVKNLTQTEETLYTQYLSSLCSYVSQKGVCPGIWGDMLYYHPEIGKSFTRDVMVFDWNYVGHRKESARFLKENGFKNVVVCNSDSGPITLFGCNLTNIDGIHTDSEEFESFFTDYREVYGDGQAMVTSWEHQYGHLLWAQLYAITRSSLYLNGEIDHKKQTAAQIEEMVERRLFGRITPYSAVSACLREAQAEVYTAFNDSIADDGKPVSFWQIFKIPYQKEAVFYLLQYAGRIDDRLAERLKAAASRAEDMLDGWNTQTHIEEIGKCSLQVSVAKIRSFAALLDFGSRGKRNYHEAARNRWEDHLKSADAITSIIADVQSVQTALDELRKRTIAAVALIGHTKEDVRLIATMKRNMQAFEESLWRVFRNLTESMCVVPSWQKLLDERETYWYFVEEAEHC